MIKRDVSKELLKLADQFKAVAVIGPRQSGKTTLTRHAFRRKPYVNLENPDLRRFAIEDPRGFLSQYRNGAVIDEAQRAPLLFSYLQQVLDENKNPGQFILTGSNNFLLQENISQSLAGRIAYLNLLPFSYYELPRRASVGLNEIIFKGLYPPLYDQPVTPSAWFANYIRTYIERDVRQVKNITDLNAFEKFLRLCAGRTGQLLNMNSLAVETGVDNKTIGSWIGILESSYILFRLYPHHRNFNKRVMKMPKLYFYDTGLVCALLGITNVQQLDFHPHFGSLFENFIISELIKLRYNRAQNNNFWFWRDNTGHEVDVVAEEAGKLYAMEIKSGKTITNEFFSGILFWHKISGARTGVVIYAGDTPRRRSDNIEVIPWRSINSIQFIN